MKWLLKRPIEQKYIGMRYRSLAKGGEDKQVKVQEIKVSGKFMRSKIFVMASQEMQSKGFVRRYSFRIGYRVG